MKFSYCLLLIVLTFVLSVGSMGQTTIFSENIGTPSATTVITSYTGWQNNGTLTYSGNGDVRTSTPSSGYTGSSGNGNVFITNTIGKDFQISGINTTSYTNLILSFGIYKSTTASNGTELIVEVSSDGSSYTILSFSLSTGSGTATWSNQTATGSIPSTPNLRIRFRQNSNTPQFRIDDVKLIGTLSAVSEPTTQTSNISFPTVGATSMTLNWTNGDGTSRLVVAHSGSAVDTDPIDLTSYAANSLFGSGSQIGTGNYVVYSGIGTSVTVTGLTSSTAYHFRVYEYNGTGLTSNYLISTSTSNPNSQSTLAPVSTSSDIVAAGNETANIAYANYQSSSITTSSDAVRLFSFTIRDGGGSADADANPTQLSAITFTKGASNTVTNWGSTIRKAALFSGSTKIAEVDVTGETILFSGLSGANVQAADDGSKTLDLYLTFESIIADNQQLQFQITNASASAAISGSSSFASFSAVNSDVTGDANRIEVTATKLAFTVQPTSQVEINAAFSASVAAVDSNNNSDLDATTSVTLLRGSGAGTLSSVSGLTKSLVGGTNSWNDLILNATETGITLTTTNTGSLTNATTNSFDVVSGVNLFNEDFNYTAGTDVTANGWTAHSGAGTTPIKISSSGLSYTGYSNSGIGNAANIFGTGEDVNKGFTSQKLNGTSVFLSALVNITEATSSQSGEYFLLIGSRDPNTPTSFTNFCARVFVKVTSDNVNFGLSNASSTAAYSATNYVKNTTYLLVVKYTINTSGNDIAKLWIFSSGVPATEAAAGNAEITVTDAAQDSVNTIALRQASGLPDVIVDGIRISTSWSNLNIPTVKGVSSFTTKTVSFGNITVGLNKVDTSVSIFNTGTGSLNISSLVSNNGQVTISPANAILAPGANQVFQITYTPTAGTLAASTIVVTSNGAVPSDTISITGTGILPTVSFSSSSKSFGSVMQNISKKDSITVTNSGPGDLLITSVSSDNAEFVVTPNGANTIASGNFGKYYITFIPSSIGNKSGHIIFTHNNVPKIKDSIAVDGIGFVQGICSFNTKTISFGNVTVGQNKIVANLSITNTGSGPMNISSIISSDGQVSVSPSSFSLATSASQSLQITYTPTSGSSITSRIIITSDGVNASDTITISGTGILPTITLSSNVKSFGSVLQNTSKKDSVVVSNAGPGDLLISSVSSDNVEFVVAPNGSNILTPGNSAKYFITFSPLSIGNKSGNIIFNHNNVLKSKDSLAVDGIGSLSGFGLSVTNKNLGNVRKAKSKTDSIIVFNNGSAAISISSVTSDNVEFIISPASASLQPSESKSFLITFTPVDLGLQTGNIIFTHDGSTIDTVKIKGFGVLPAYAIRSHLLNQGSVGIGKSKRDSLYILNMGTDTLHLDSVFQNRSEFTVTITGDQNYASVAPADSKKVYIKFSPTVVGLLKDTLIIYHDGPSVRDTIFVSAKGEQSIFAISQKTISFGTVIANITKKDSVTVTNTGTFPLVINSAISSNTEFIISPTNATLDTNTSQRFMVSFTPTGSGTRSGKIVFTHNAGSMSDTVSVSGTGLLITTIKDARLAANGTEVLFDGIVTRAKGGYTYLQDSSAAIVLFQSSGAWKDSVANGNIKTGDKIRVQGRTSELNSLKEIITTDLVSFSRISRNNIFPAVPIVSLKTLTANGEEYESEVVKVTGIKIMSTDTIFTAAKSYTITDPTDTSKSIVLRIPNAADGDVDGMKVSPKLITFNGVLGQFSSANPAIGYQLMAIDSSDIIENVLSVDDHFSNVPESYELHNNYPNPFNPSTTILYGLPKRSNVSVKIYSILGQEVKSLVDDMQNPNYYRVVWNGTNNSGNQVSSGLYFVRISAFSNEAGAKQFVQVKKMLLMK